jgi:hypothetical protein
MAAQVDDPYARDESGRPPLKMGSFVEAKISGKTFTNVFVIPRSALHEGRDILLDVDGKLKRQTVNIVWSQGNDIVVSGLQAGAKLIITPPAYAVDGADITIKGSTKPKAEKATDAPAKEED